MNTYALEIVTVPGFADPVFLDRLSDIAYAVDELVNLHMGLNDDGSLSVFFDVEAAWSLAAAELGVRLFTGALANARPVGVEGAQAIARFEVSAVSLPDRATA